jgi:hypothetical protein
MLSGFLAPSPHAIVWKAFCKGNLDCFCVEKFECVIVLVVDFEE